MFQIRRIAAAVVGLVALACAAAACGGDEVADNKSGAPIVIGAAVAKSGIMSQFDQPVVEGAQVAITEINKAGGVDGRKLKLEVADHKSDLNLVQQSALDVIDKGAQMVVVTCDYDYGSAAASVADGS